MYILYVVYTHSLAITYIQAYNIYCTLSEITIINQYLCKRMLARVTRHHKNDCIGIFANPVL